MGCQSALLRTLVTLLQSTITIMVKEHTQLKLDVMHATVPAICECNNAGK